MAKADLKAAQETYDALLHAAKLAEHAGRYAEVLAHCSAAWEHVDAMMRYERRYEGTEFKSVQCIDLALKYAPLLFHHQSLDAIEQLLKAQRSVERNTTDDLGQRLAEARARMRSAHRLWSHVEQRPGSKQSELHETLGGEQKQWLRLVEQWASMGLVARIISEGHCRLRLVTDLDEPIEGKCPECGAGVTEPKSRFLVPRACPRCRKTTMLVMLGSADGTA